MNEQSQDPEKKIEVKKLLLNIGRWIIPVITVFLYVGVEFYKAQIGNSYDLKDTNKFKLEVQASYEQFFGKYPDFKEGEGFQYASNNSSCVALHPHIFMSGTWYKEFSRLKKLHEESPNDKGVLGKFVAQLSVLNHEKNHFDTQGNYNRVSRVLIYDIPYAILPQSTNVEESSAVKYQFESIINSPEIATAFSTDLAPIIQSLTFEVFYATFTDEMNPLFLDWSKEKEFVKYYYKNQGIIPFGDLMQIYYINKILEESQNGKNSPTYLKLISKLQVLGISKYEELFSVENLRVNRNKLVKELEIKKRRLDINFLKNRRQ